MFHASRRAARQIMLSSVLAVCLCFFLQIIEEVSPRSKDMILSIGERLSCRLVVGALCNAGVPAELVGLETIIDAAFLDDLSQRSTGPSSQGEGALEQSFYELLSERIGERVGQADTTPVVTGELQASRLLSSERDEASGAHHALLRPPCGSQAILAMCLALCSRRWVVATRTFVLLFVQLVWQRRNCRSGKR